MRRTTGLAFHVVRLLAAGAALRRLARGLQRSPPLSAIRPGQHLDASVTAVIPARNEAARISPCLAAVLSDAQVSEVVVIDDQSSDETAAVAATAGARVIRGEPPPPGWVGKPWALQQGLDAARGDWVLCLDADTVPRPGLVGALLRCAAEQRLDLVSGAPRFLTGGGLDQALHASMLASLVYRFGPPRPEPPRTPHRAVINGQCILVRREALIAEGGFALARGAMTDDVALGRALAFRGWSVGMVDAGDLLDVRMHTSATEVWREWGRSLPMADVTSRSWLVRDLTVIWLAQALPAVRLILRRGDLVDVLLCAARIGTAVGVAGAYARPRRGVWFAPLLDVPVAVLLTTGAIRPRRSWRGRTYAPPFRRWRLARSGPR